MSKRRGHVCPNVADVSGARGGSFVRLAPGETEGMCRIEVGHSCVVTVDKEIPVTWLAAVLTHASDNGWIAAMGDREEFPADYALMCDPEKVA